MSLPADLVERPVEAEDIPGLVALIARCDATYAEWAGDWSAPDADDEAQRWTDHLERPGQWDHLAESPEGIVGVVAWRRAVTEDGSEIPGVAHVNAVFTDPARWGEGIAAHLLGAAMDEAVRRRYRVARLWTPRDAPARGFYLRQGWTPDGRAKWEPRFHLHLIGFERRLPVWGRRGSEGS